MRDFLAMGGYGAYVWPAYGLTLAVLVLNVWVPWNRHRKLRNRLARRRGHR